MAVLAELMRTCVRANLRSLAARLSRATADAQPIRQPLVSPLIPPRRMSREQSAAAEAAYSANRLPPSTYFPRNSLEEWLDTLPDDVRPNAMLQLKDESAAQSVLLGSRTKRIPAKAGDLIIWDTRLPHSAASNVGNAPRVAQYEN